jgi:hypothetical protein
MSDMPPENGYRRGRPGLPTGIVIAAVVIALVAVSLLLLLLYRETRGPGEILREFARAVDDGDCTGSYELLDAGVQAEIGEDVWCSGLAAVDGSIDADFALERAVLEGDQAEVHVSGVPVEAWRLRRYGERSWRVLGPEGGFPAG